MPADELGALAVDVFGADRVSVSPRLGEAIGEAIELAEAGPDDALGGSGVLVTGSVITAGEARTLLAGRRAVKAADPVRAGRALGGAAAGDPGAGGHRRPVRAPRPSRRPTGWRLPADAPARPRLLLILAAGIQRRERGLLIGTALQVPLLLTGLLTAPCGSSLARSC